jgi:hypothetical protein
MHATPFIFTAKKKKRKRKKRKKQQQQLMFLAAVFNTLSTKKMVGKKRKREDGDDGNRESKKTKVIKVIDLDDEADTHCQICFEEMANATKWSGCKHEICKSCAEKLIKQRDSCPFCKKPFEFAQPSTGEKIENKDLVEDANNYRRSLRAESNLDDFLLAADLVPDLVVNLNYNDIGQFNGNVFIRQAISGGGVSGPRRTNATRYVSIGGGSLPTIQVPPVFDR